MAEPAPRPDTTRPQRLVHSYRDAGSTGIAHSVGECRGYFERAGARDVAAHEFVPGVLTRVTGRRP